MIHFIIILHFAAISVGVITLMLLWQQYMRCREEVTKWLFLADLVLTTNMILDSVKIYISKNVSISSPVLWGMFEFSMNILFFAAVLASIKLISATTGRSIHRNILLLFFVILPILAAGVIGNMAGITESQYVLYGCFGSILICSILYGLYCMPMADPKYLPITVICPIAAAANLLAFFLASSLPGIPEWLHRIPYFQIIYLVLNIFGAIYVIKTMQNDVQEASNENSTANAENYLDKLGREYNLTGRELEIIGELILGKNNKDIGDSLFVSPNTVKNHIYNIYKKVGVKNRYELIALISNNCGKQL